MATQLSLPVLSPSPSSQGEEGALLLLMCLERAGCRFETPSQGLPTFG